MLETYGLDLHLPGQRAADWRVADSLLRAGPVTTGDLQLAGALAFRVDPAECIVINTVVEGRADVVGNGVEERCRAGDVFAANHPDLHGVCHTYDLRARTLSLPRALLTEVAASVQGAPGTDWRLTSLRPAPDTRERWHRMLAFVDTLLSDAEAMATPLLIGPAARLAAATVLACFPHTAGPGAIEQPRDVHPESMRRAITYLEAHADRDLTIGEVAAATGVGPRALQLAFRRHLRTTPTAYQRGVRLRHAHAQLRRATPEDGTTVARVALDWGFASASRFAARYREMFGELPSETLRS